LLQVEVDLERQLVEVVDQVVVVAVVLEQVVYQFVDQHLIH
jgi:hypothetical protein